MSLGTSPPHFRRAAPLPYANDANVRPNAGCIAPRIAAVRLGLSLDPTNARVRSVTSPRASSPRSRRRTGESSSRPITSLA
jgi:hypothetical protein